ncbi:MAG TPA: hypothetical protein VIM61_12470 [Chthoniobacterales bacterium]
MKTRVLLAALLVVLGAAPLHAAKSRDELLFQINAALLAGDRAAFTRCINFAGSDKATRASFTKIVEQIFRWPTHYVFATDRKDHDNPRIEQGGKFYRLNGDWRFQVHIFLSKKTSAGFVFPAGSVEGKYFVLVAVPEKTP